MDPLPRRPYELMEGKLEFFSFIACELTEEERRDIRCFIPELHKKGYRASLLQWVTEISGYFYIWTYWNDRQLPLYQRCFFEVKNNNINQNLNLTCMSCSFFQRLFQLGTRSPTYQPMSQGPQLFEYMSIISLLNFKALASDWSVEWMLSLYRRIPYQKNKRKYLSLILWYPGLSCSKSG